MGEEKPKKGLSVAAIVVIGVVAICCLSSLALGGIGYSSFQSYLIRSKTAEAGSNLRNLYQLSAAYYASEQWPTGAVVAGAAAQTACTVGPARTSNVPSAQKTMLDWDGEPESFSALGFAIADPIYYQYEIAGAPGRCGNAPSRPIYTLRAHGDLDDDGDRSLFELDVRSNVDNDLERDPAVRSTNEEE